MIRRDLYLWSGKVRTTAAAVHHQVKQYSRSIEYSSTAKGQKRCIFTQQQYKAYLRHTSRNCGVSFNSILLLLWSFYTYLRKQNRPTHREREREVQLLLRCWLVRLTGGPRCRRTSMMDQYWCWMEGRLNLLLLLQIADNKLGTAARVGYRAAVSSHTTKSTIMIIHIILCMIHICTYHIIYHIRSIKDTI